MCHATSFTPLRWRKKKGKLIPTFNNKPGTDKTSTEVSRPDAEQEHQVESKEKEQINLPPKLEVKKPEIKIKPTETNQVSSLSISSVKRKKDWEQQQKPTEKVDNLPTEVFSEEELLKVWNHYQQMKYKKGDQNVASLLKISTPTLIDKNLVIFNVPTDLNKVELEREFTDFVPYLRANLKNYDLLIKVVVDQKTEKNFIYTPEEKYNRLKEINPVIDKLRKELDLDL